jgi:hypothetical protein
MRADNSPTIDMKNVSALPIFDRHEVFGPDVAVVTRKVALELLETPDNCMLHIKQGT